jgi:hypothetical protein
VIEVEGPVEVAEKTNVLLRRMTFGCCGGKITVGAGDHTGERPIVVSARFIGLPRSVAETLW